MLCRFRCHDFIKEKLLKHLLCLMRNVDRFPFAEKPIRQEHDTNGAVCVRVAGVPRPAAL